MFGLLLLIAASLVAVLLWKGSFRSSCADCASQDARHELRPVS